MKKLLFLSVVSVICSCKNFQHQVHGNYIKTYDDGYVVEFIGYETPADTLRELYPIKETDSVILEFDTVTQTHNFVIIEANRLVIVDQQKRLIRIDSLR